MKDITLKIRLEKKQLESWKRFVKVYGLDSVSALVRSSVREKMEVSSVKSDKR